MSETAAPAGPAPLTGAPLLITATALALGTFMQVLDSTIANVSIPTIAGNLGVSSDEGTWVITAFAVANGISVPLTGWLMQRFGAVRTFVTCVLLFTTASFLCGISWSLPSLVVFRVLQGGLSGPLIPGSQALLISIFPAERRGAALGVWSMTTLVAPICGPILGGYLSDDWSWPWIFFINVPVGIFCAAVSWHFLARRDAGPRRIRVDRVGFGLLVIWVGALQIMLDKGKDADWFSSTFIVVLALIAVVGFIAWVIWEMTDDQPLVDLSLFKRRNFSFGCLALALGYAVFFGNTLLLPLWLQTNLGYTATLAGLVLAPSGAVAVVATIFAAGPLSRLDPRWTATAAFLSFALSFYLRSHLTPDATFGDFVVPLLVQGVGTGVFFVAMVTISLSGIPGPRLPAATGLSNFARLTAGSFAASITTTIWDRREAFHQTRLSEAASMHQPALTQSLAQLGNAGLPETQSLAYLARELTNQSYVMASVDYFWVSTWICVLMIPVIWLTSRAYTSGGPPVAAD